MTLFRRVARAAIASVLSAFALVVLAGCAWSDNPRVGRPTDGDQIIAFGDSLVEGVGATRGRDFVSVLSERLGVPIVNAGRRGDTTASALALLDSAVLARSPRVVIVLLGGNDFLRNVSRETTFQNLRTIVKRIRDRGAAVVLVGVKVNLLVDSYGVEYERVASELSAAVVRDILGEIIGRPDRMSDSIHPNDRGYEIIAERLEPVVRDLME